MQHFWRMSLDVMPDSAPSRLWIACGEADMKWVQISKASKNPYKDTAMRYTHEGNYVTGWITAGFLDLSKLNTFLTLNTNGLSAGVKEIKVDYQLETGDLDSGWTNIGTYNTSPWQQSVVAAAYNVAGRMFRLRFRFIALSASSTPVLKAWILDELLRFPVKFAYTLRYRVRDNDVDMRNMADATARAETKLSTLDTWGTALTALTFRNPYSSYDNKKVVVEPTGTRPIGTIIKDGVEFHVGELTLLEI